MIFSRYYGHLIENLAVKHGLLREPRKSIFRALQFEAGQFTIDHGQIYSDRPRPNPHFFNNSRVLVASVCNLQLRSNRYSYIAVSHIRPPRSSIFCCHPPMNIRE